MDTELVARLRAVIPRLARVLNDTSTGEDLTPTQYSVLALVRVRGPLGLTELTELEGLNPTMLSRIVKVLDERGLIRRMPDPGDLRAARVAVTPAGEQVHDRVRAQRTKVLLSACTACRRRRRPRCSRRSPTSRHWPRRSSRGRPVKADARSRTGSADSGRPPSLRGAANPLRQAEPRQRRRHEQCRAGDAADHRDPQRGPQPDGHPEHPAEQRAERPCPVVDRRERAARPATAPRRVSPRRRSTRSRCQAP